MAFIHEKRLQDAVKRLHMLGSPDGQSHHGEDGGDVGAGFMGAVVQAAKSKAPKEMSQAQKSDSMKSAYMQAAIQSAGQKRRELAFMQGTGASKGMALEGLGRTGMGAGSETPDIQEAVAVPTDPYKQAGNFASINALAEKSRIGGRYTPTGLDMAADEAELNAADRLKMKSMIGLGGTVAPRF